MNVKELLQNKKLLAAIAVVLVAVLLICLIAGGNKAEKAVKTYIKYAQKEEPEKLYKTLPKALRTILEDEKDDDEYIEDLEESCENFTDYYDDCKFEILDVSKMSEDDLEDYQDYYEDIAEEFDAKLNVQAGRYVIFKAIDEDGYVVDVGMYNVLKINGTWCVARLGNYFNVYLIEE